MRNDRLDKEGGTKNTLCIIYRPIPKLKEIRTDVNRGMVCVLKDTSSVLGGL